MLATGWLHWVITGIPLAIATRLWLPMPIPPQIPLRRNCRNMWVASFTGWPRGFFGRPGNRPTVNPIEMGMANPETVVKRLQANLCTKPLFMRLYGEQIFDKPESADATPPRTWLWQRVADL